MILTSPRNVGPLGIVQIELRFLGQYMVNVISDRLLLRNIGQKVFFIPEMQRRPTCNTGPQHENMLQFRTHGLTKFRQIRTRPHQAHVAAEHVEELRQFV